jgi:cytochrome c biogenesis protein CcmG/thiol:disulfide interchange protein DsbE
MKRWLVVILLLCCATLPSGAKAPASGAGPAPRFDLPARAGRAALDSLRGRVVYVDFWASWCEPCRKSFPWLASMHERYGKQGLTIVAINLDKERPAADAFLVRNPAPFTVAFDPEGRTADAFKVTGMPSSFLIGRTGDIVYSHVGFDPRKTAPVEALIREACSR